LFIFPADFGKIQDSLLNMESQFSDLFPVVVLGLTLWLIGLSVFVYRVFAHYKKLGKGVKAGNLVKVLEKVFESETACKKDLEQIELEVKELRSRAMGHVQKVGLVRFNPFDEIGGDQSFCLSLLDEKDDGFVISCLHARDRTRVYAKPVVKGESEYELSKDEIKAIKEARKKK
jgi:hypothetical protein